MLLSLAVRFTLFTLFANCLVLSAVQAQTIFISHCQGICPSYNSELAAERANIVVHRLYAAGLNGETGLADWLAYGLSKDAVGVGSLLPRLWQPDDLIKYSGIRELPPLSISEYSELELSGASSPYYGGLEEAIEVESRVRLAPITSYANTPYWPELNQLSNMLPMPRELRLGAWAQLDQVLNESLAALNQLHVISGPLLVKNQQSTDPAFNAVAYYKIVVADSGTATFVFPSDLEQHAFYCGQLGNLHEVESMSGLTFFPAQERQTSRQLIADLGCSETAR